MKFLFEFAIIVVMLIVSWIFCYWKGLKHGEENGWWEGYLKAQQEFQSSEQITEEEVNS